MARAALTSTSSPRRISWPATYAALVVTLVSLAPILVGRRYLGLDHSRVLLSMMCGGRGADGAILDASFGGGGPLLEEPQGLVLYPTSWLLRFLDVELAASLFVVIHLALAAAVATHLARAKGLSRPISFAFGVSFATCGSVLDLILHGPYLVGAAGVALAWAGAAHFTRRASSSSSARTGMFLLASGPALLLLSGELQSFGVAFAIVIVELALVRPVSRALRALLAFIAGALVGGAQLFVSLALAAATSRSSRVDDPYLWSLEPAQLLGVVWPGDLIERAANGASLLTAVTGDALARPPWNLTPFLGAPVLALACVGVVVALVRFVRVRRRSRRSSASRMFVPSLVAIFATLFALGDRTPVLGVALTLVPPLGFFRYPAKYFVVASLALLLLAFFVVTIAARSARARRMMQGALGIAAVACAIGVVVALVQRAHVDTLAAAVASRPPWPGLSTLGSLLVERASLALALAAVVTLVTFTSRTRAAIPFVLALGVVVPFARGLPTGEPLTSLPPRDASLKINADAPAPLVCHGRNIGARHVDRADETEPLGIEGDVIVDWLDLKPNMHQCQDVAVPHAAMASSQKPTFVLATTLDERARLPTQAWALGCTHVATRVPPQELVASLDVSRAIAPAAGVDAPIYPLRTPASDVAIARAPRFFGNADDALAALPTLTAPDDVANLIDDPAHAFAAPPSLPVPAAPRDVRVAATWTSTTETTLSFASPQAQGAVVALRRPWWPGFTATQAGAPIPVVRAAGVQLALVVEDVTRGDVVVTYRVKNAKLAGVSFVLGLVLFALLVVLSQRGQGAVEANGRRQP